MGAGEDIARLKGIAPDMYRQANEPANRARTSLVTLALVADRAHRSGDPISAGSATLRGLETMAENFSGMLETDSARFVHYLGGLLDQLDLKVVRK